MWMRRLEAGGPAPTRPNKYAATQPRNSSTEDHTPPKAMVSDDPRSTTDQKHPMAPGVNRFAAHPRPIPSHRESRCSDCVAPKIRDLNRTVLSTTTKGN